MHRIYALKTPELFHIIDEQEEKYYGGDQAWYPTEWQQKSGCGPTSCAHLLWYLSQTKNQYKNLTTQDARWQKGFVQLMEEVWEDVTPGKLGVNSTQMFCDGARNYGKKKGVSLSFQVQDVPHRLRRRPTKAQLTDFLCDAFSEDLPVAFLNLSNGKEQRLESWHWVVLTGFDPAQMTATVYDQGNVFQTDLGLWLKTSFLGGGFVAIR